jgi:hypothetical protein
MKRSNFTGGILAAILPIISGILPPMFVRRDRRHDGEKMSTRKEKKYCLTCGRPHFHNNSFCSGECCRIFYRKKKGN